MNYPVTLTKRNYIILPKEIRHHLDFKPGDRVILEQKSGYAILRKAKDILDYAGSIKVPKKMRSLKGILKAREIMEKTYERF